MLETKQDRTPPTAGQEDEASEEDWVIEDVPKTKKSQSSAPSKKPEKKVDPSDDSGSEESPDSDGGEADKVPPKPTRGRPSQVDKSKQGGATKRARQQKGISCWWKTAVIDDPPLSGRLFHFYHVHAFHIIHMTFYYDRPNIEKSETHIRQR